MIKFTNRTIFYQPLWPIVYCAGRLISSPGQPLWPMVYCAGRLISSPGRPRMDVDVLNKWIELYVLNKWMVLLSD